MMPLPTHMSQTIYFGFDHGGCKVAPALIAWLEEQGHLVTYFGNVPCDSADDYPDFASEVALHIQRDPEARGIVMCRSGGGVCIVANKFKGVRAALATTETQAISSAKDDHAQMLCLSADLSSEEEMKTLISAFLSTSWEAGRHERRVGKVEAIEEENFREVPLQALSNPTDVEVSPSLLSCDLSRLQEEVSRLEPLVDRWHFDVMDYRFVPNMTFGMPLLKHLQTDIPIDAHLMVEDPLPYLPDMSPYCDVVYLHTETIRGREQDVIETALTHDLRPGLTWRPSTPFSEIEKLLPLVSHVLIMTVEPGCSGQEIIAEALETIAKVRASYPDMHINVDGGMDAETSKIARSHGADCIVSGSFLFKAKDTVEAVKQLRGEQ